MTNKLYDFIKFFESDQINETNPIENTNGSTDKDAEENTNVDAEQKLVGNNQLSIPFDSDEEEEENSKKEVQNLEEEPSDDTKSSEEKKEETPVDLGELTISDDPIEIGDFVVCINKEGLGPRALAFLESKVYFKVFNITETGKVDLGNDIVFNAPRFKKIELSSDIKVGDIVVVRDKSQKNLPADIYKYILSKPYFEVLSMKDTKGTVSLDIGFKGTDGKPYLFNINRFLSSKKLSEKNKEKYNDDKLYIQQNIDHPFIDPTKLEIAKIKDIEDVSVNYDSISLKGKKEASMNIKRFLTYFKPLGPEHQKLVDKKIRDIDHQKREELDSLIKKFETIFKYYRNVTDLIKKIE